MGSYKTTAAGFAMLAIAGFAAFAVQRGVQPDGSGHADATSLHFPSSPRGIVSRSPAMDFQHPDGGQITNASEQSRHEDPQHAEPGGSNGKLDRDSSPRAHEPGTHRRSRLATRSSHASLDRQASPAGESIDQTMPAEVYAQAAALAPPPDKSPTSDQSPRLSVAATLATTLTDAELSELGAHQKAAILELGSFVDDTSGNAPVGSPAAGTSTPVSWTRSDYDDSLRATLGHDGFNQLSFLAAAKRHLATQAAVSSRQ